MNLKSEGYVAKILSQFLQIFSIDHFSSEEVFNITAVKEIEEVCCGSISIQGPYRYCLTNEPHTKYAACGNIRVLR